MSRQDRLTQTRGLLLIQSDGEFTCKRSTKICAVFSLSSLFSLQEHQGLMKRTQRCLSQQYWHFICFIYLFFFHLFGMESYHVAWATKMGFQSATAEGWWVLLCTATDEDFSYSAVIIDIMKKSNLYNIINEKQKICHAFHPPPLPYAMNSRLQRAYSVAISAMVCHPLASPPHRAAFDFKSWTILQHLLMWFCK